MASGRNGRMVLRAIGSLILVGESCVVVMGFGRGAKVATVGWGGRGRMDTVERSFRMLWWW